MGEWGSLKTPPFELMISTVLALAAGLCAVIYAATGKPPLWVPVLLMSLAILVPAVGL